MPTQLNLIMPVKEFLHYVYELQNKYGVFLYIEKRDSEKTRIVEPIKDVKNIEINEEYSGFYFSAHPVPPKASFFDAGIFHYCLEGNGGRTVKNDMEMITLRVISKTPDATIKKFFNSILGKLKKDALFSKGVYSASGQAYKTTFYLKSVANKYSTWFDFERKTAPIKFEP